MFLRNLFLLQNNNQWTNNLWIGPIKALFYGYRVMHKNDNQSFPRIPITYPSKENQRLRTAAEQLSAANDQTPF